MSLYNNLFRVNPFAGFLLTEVLKLTLDDVPRFRDCFVHDGCIVLHTRSGGGNREAYKKENDALTERPHYLRNSDDDFDSTYANFYFQFPAEHQEILKDIEEKCPVKTPAERWQAVINGDMTPEQQQVGKRIVNELLKGVSDE